MAHVMSCPTCSIPMDRRIASRDPKAKRFEFDQCPKCGALWLDEFETPELGQPVAKLAFQTEQLAERWPASARLSACPRCGTAGAAGLREVKLLDVVMDYCLRCRGIHFDAGEVEALIQAVTEVEQSRATGSYRAAPRVQRAIGARSFECSRCGTEQPTRESCILPAGLVCGGCFYAHEEAALESSAGAGFGEEFAAEVPSPIRNARPEGVYAEPVFSRLGIVLGGLGLEYCIICGRRPYDLDCKH